MEMMLDWTMIKLYILVEARSNFQIKKRIPTAEMQSFVTIKARSDD